MLAEDLKLVDQEQSNKDRSSGEASSEATTSISGEREAWDEMRGGAASAEVQPREVEEDSCTSGTLDHEDQHTVLNQVERFERLMKVLSLLKNASNFGDFDGSVGEVAELQELKEHVKLALDEAVQLRRETAAMQSKIGVRGTIRVGG